jgi:DNA-binding IclR family transcriptional regulator
VAEPAREYGIQVLTKGFTVLEALLRVRQMGINDLVAAAGLPKTTVFRLVHALAELGYVDRAPDGRYGLGLSFLKFAAAFYARNELRQAAAQPMRELNERYSDTVNLAVFDGHHLVYLDILEGVYPFRMSAQVGAWVPLHATALGKAVAAHLPDGDLRSVVGREGLASFTPRTVRSIQELQQQLAKVRRDGYALDDQEMEPGARCVAAAIFGRDGRVVGGLSLSGPVHRLTDEVLPTMARDVQSASERISRWLGFWPGA